MLLDYLPELEDFTINTTVTLDNTTGIAVVLSDIEDMQSNLTLEIEYMHVGGGNWSSDYIKNITFNAVDDEWTADFEVQVEARVGYYYFRIRITDPDNGSSGWLNMTENDDSLNDLIDVINNPPVIDDVWFSSETVKRGDIISIYVEFTGDRPGDGEYWSDPVNNYTGIEFKYLSYGDWISSGLTAIGYVEGTGLRIDFETEPTSQLGEIEWRVRLVINESGMSEWFYPTPHTNITNNLPVIYDVDFTSDEVTRVTGVLPIHVMTDDREDVDNDDWAGQDLVVPYGEYLEDGEWRSAGFVSRYYYEKASSPGTTISPETTGY